MPIRIDSCCHELCKGGRKVDGNGGACTRVEVYTRCPPGSLFNLCVCVTFNIVFIHVIYSKIVSLVERIGYTLYACLTFFCRSGSITCHLYINARIGHSHVDSYL
jgi:hypothetical protein